MTSPRLLSSTLFTLTASLFIGCGSASTPPEGAGEEPDAAQAENAILGRSCATQCAVDYSACFQFSDGDLCGCYPSYVSCMKQKCHARPGFEPPTCTDAGPADSGTPDSASPDATDPCPIECHCPYHAVPACTNTCAECKAACNVPYYQPCG